jgi:hypothetical protein
MIAASIVELTKRSQDNLIWLKAGHADPSIDRNLDKRVAELENNFQELLKLLQALHPLASTKENIVFGDDPSPSHEQVEKEQTTLLTRRARLLERIEETKELSYENPSDGNALADLQDELAAVESALGFPEPKEPQEANSPSFCPTCLCLLNHEDPSQSCQCADDEPDSASDETITNH